MNTSNMNRKNCLLFMMRIWRVLTWNRLLHSICLILCIVFLLGAGARIWADKNPKEQFSSDTLLWLFAAATMLLLPRIKSFALGNYKAEFHELKHEIKQARELAIAANDIGGTALQSSSNRSQLFKTAAEMLDDAGIVADLDKTKNDPWKNKFGGKLKANGRHVYATVEPVIGDKNWFLVRLVVEPTLGGEALDLPVYFYIHSDFPQNQLRVMPHHSRAELVIRAWGAFTVGVLTDNGDTRLELDLAENNTYPSLFRER
jgi:hypothetical protein